MFSLKQITENGFNIFLLRNDADGSYVKITPEACASIHAFGIQNSETDVQVIDQFTSLSQFHSKHPGHKGSKLAPFVCRLRNGKYSFEGKDYQVENLNDKGKHALHGFLAHKSYSLSGTEVTNVSAGASFKYVYDHEDKGYPFKFETVITHRLVEERKLEVTSAYTNLSDTPIPIQDGWHPYFDLGEKADDLELEFQVTNQYVFDEDLVPTGKKVPYNEFAKMKKIGAIHLDNSFTLDRSKPEPLCTLRSNKNKIEVNIIPDISYPILQIYTPPTRESVAIENLSGPPDDFNLKEYIKILNPGESAFFTVTYQINII